MDFIVNIVKKYTWSLLLIYFYIFANQLVFLAEPYVLGKSIDGLLHKQYEWLGVFLGMEIVAIGFMYKRMVFDTKVYTKIYNEISLQYLKHDKDSNTSTRVARTDMAYNIIHFLENDIHYYIASILTIIGSLFFIFLEHSLTGFVVSLCVIPILFIVFKFYKKIGQGTRAGNTLYEQKMQIMDTGIMSLIKNFFDRRAKIAIYQSTVQGKNWASLNFTKTVFLVLALIIFTYGNITLTPGQVTSMYSYINQFLISLMSIPVGMETFTRIKDVINRIKAPIIK